LEFWEGAILVVGGLWLVSHMAKRQAPVAAVNNTGVSNASNLTTITNQAGGLPTIAGESLVAPTPLMQAPLAVSRVVAYPVTPSGTPIARAPLSSAPVYKAPVVVSPVRVGGVRPMQAYV
jgi:hypothetical protein